MTDEHMREGFEHLQAAAVEIIGAMRAFLDAAEAVVRDPSELVQAVNELAETARAAASQMARPPGAAAEGSEPRPDPGVTRISVS
jgi:hypothetical protein